MDWSNRWQIFNLISTVLSDLSVLYLFGKDFLTWRRYRKAGMATRLSFEHPKVMLSLLCASLCTGFFCIWIAFHPRQTESNTVSHPQPQIAVKPQHPRRHEVIPPNGDGPQNKEQSATAPPTVAPAPVSATSPYIDVQMETADINRWARDYAERIQNIPAEAHRTYVVIPHGDPEYRDTPEKAANEKRDEDRAIKSQFTDLNTSANKWMEKNEPSLRRIHTAAINYMKPIKSQEWTVDALKDDDQTFANAMAAASKAATYTDIDDKRINKDRFTLLKAYFDALLKKMGSYP